MTQPPFPAAPPPEGTRPPAPGGYPPPSGYPPPPGYPPRGYAPQQRQPGYAPPPGQPGYPPQPGHPGYGPPGHPGQFPPLPPPASPAGQPLATFLDRFLAYLVDSAVFMGVGLVLAVPVMIVFFVAVMPDLVETQPDGTPAEPDVAAVLVPMLLIYGGIFLISLALSYIYYVEMMFRTGQTLGKRVMKIRTVTLDPNGSLTRGIAVKRLLVVYACGLVPGLGYVDGLWQLWDKPYQQCLHDKFAKTVVVKVPA